MKPKNALDYLVEVHEFLKKYKKWYRDNKETIATLDEGSNPTQPPPPPDPNDEDGE